MPGPAKTAQPPEGGRVLTDNWMGHLYYCVSSASPTWTFFLYTPIWMSDGQCRPTRRWESAGSIQGNSHNKQPL